MPRYSLSECSGRHPLPAHFLSLEFLQTQATSLLRRTWRQLRTLPAESYRPAATASRLLAELIQPPAPEQPLEEVGG